MYPIESWAIDSTAERRRDRVPRFYDSDFPLGQLEPHYDICKPRIPPASRVNYNGDITNVAPGEVISGLNVNGRIIPNNPCTIKDSLIRGVPTDPLDAVGLFDGGSNEGSPVRLEFCEINPDPHMAPSINGFRRGGFSAYRCTVRNVVDSAHVHGNGSWPNTRNRVVQLHACVFNDATVFPNDPNWGGSPSHSDFVQAHGSLSLLEIIGCSFGKVGARPNTTIILLQQHHGIYGKIRIEDNWFYGNTEGGATFNMSAQRSQVYDTDVLSFKRNRIDRAGHAPRLLVKDSHWYPAVYGWTGTDLSNPNTWVPGADASIFMDDGSPVPISNGGVG